MPLTAHADHGVEIQATIEPVELRFHPITVPGQLDLAINCWGGLEQEEYADGDDSLITPDDPANMQIISPNVPTEPVTVGKVQYPANKTFVFRLNILPDCTEGDHLFEFKLAGNSGTVLYYELVIKVQKYLNK